MVRRLLAVGGSEGNMELLNERYKIEDVYKEEENGVVYIARDLFESNKRILLKLLNNDIRNKKVVDYFIENYIFLSSIRHSFILSSYSSDIVKTIDNKRVNKKQYFYTKEYTEAITLSEILKELSLTDIYEIIRQVCIVLSYLHFRGINYQYLNPENIFIIKESNEIKVKLRDIATITEKKIIKSFSEYNNYFIAPEIKEGFEDKNTKSDVYSLGMLVYLLFTKSKGYYDRMQLLNSVKEKLNYELQIELVELVGSMIENDPKRRLDDFKEVIDLFNKLCMKEYPYFYKAQREKLNFKHKIIGRDNEISRFLKINEQFEKRKFNKKMLTINGDSGLGKTRLLKEFEFRLRMQGKRVYFNRISDVDIGELKPIIKILRQILKECKDGLINKYGCELVKIIPEIRFTNNIKSTPILSGNREKLRLYNRIMRFIVDSVEDEPIYILLDDIHNADIETIRLIDYIVRNNEEYPLFFVLTYNEHKLRERMDLKKYVKAWFELEKVESIKVSRLNLQETAELTKNILGISFKPIVFSTRIMKETNGNPRFIEEVIKNLNVIGELFIDVNGDWETDTKNYWDIYIPSDIDEVIKNQVDLLDEGLYEVAKIISVFNTSVSKYILRRVMRIDKDKLDSIIEKLVSMKLLDEMVEDWGYTYDYYNKKIKKYIYHKIPSEERIQLHKTISEHLEELFKEESKGNIDELIHHFTLSKQREKAVDYAIKFAKKMQGLLVSSQSILLWENAYNLLMDIDSINKLEIQVNLGKLYSQQGRNNKALDIYNKAIKLATKLNKKNYIILCKNNISEIYYRKNALDKAEQYAVEAKKLAEEIDDTKGYLKATVLLNRVKFLRGENDGIINNTLKNIDIAMKAKQYFYVGHFYNQLGVAYMLKNSINEAENYLKKSVEYFNKSGETLESNMPINNIGVMYSDYFGDLDKAMEYFQKGLEVCRKYDNIQHEITFLINIGGIRIRKHQYADALEDMKKAAQLADDIEDHNNMFLINLNIALIYLYMAEYDKCFKYYKILKSDYSNMTIDPQNVSRYFGFLSCFYFEFGEWDKAIEYSKKTIESDIELDLNMYIKVETVLQLSKFYKTGVLDKKKVNEVRLKYRYTKFEGEKRESLLMFAHSAIINGDLALARELLEEDKKISESFTSEVLERKRNLLKIYSDKNNIDNLYDKLSELLNECKCQYCYKYKPIINRVLGDIKFRQQEYYEAVKHYVLAIDGIFRLAKQIPNESLKLKYIKTKGIDKIKKRIDKVKGIIFENKGIFDTFEESNNHKSEDYFDFTGLVKLFEKDNKFKATFLDVDINTSTNLKSIDDVITKITNDYEYNLNMILRFIVEQTFAKRGYILYDNESSESLEILASTNNEEITDDIEYIISRVKQSRKGLLINNSFDRKENNFLLPLSDVTKSIICVPIMKNIKRKENVALDRRKSSDLVETDEIIGYIYLETDNLFNRFDNIRYNIVCTLANLAFINIENYKLKISNSIDKMTGVYTRKYFDRVYNKIFNIANSEKASFALIMIDIDKFKNVNDTFGHQKGDEILSSIGNILLNNVRETDLVARYGGEEFAILLPDTGKEGANKVAEKIRKKVEQANLINDNYPLTISLGVSVFPDHSRFKDELVERADQALYHAKETSRNKSVMWTNEISNSTDRLDKLAGIVTGNTVQDQRNVLVIVELINLLQQKLSVEDKIYKYLGRLIEYLAASEGILFILNQENNIDKIYARKRFKDEWETEPRFNKKIIDRVIYNRKGEFLIDWDDIGNIDIVTGNPDWQSIIVVPLINDGTLKGVLQLSVPIKEKEFDYNSYNFVKTASTMLAAVI
ncbi:diguanylate cyclase [Caldisalinibacter kiritimatiensis]|uniref:Diguanylate cyclase n=1 Tax=Caldisalinibacter kiritimatiensis TaxID=1304284 RepID=R1AY99_9FIRM|nr:diguanylate cyclase [Caldisalinibacter kiritimatiensis]EOD01662.1 hypothetical protein L21TH_0268 [Caldisalinibacter kiritimatiensis]